MKRALGNVVTVVASPGLFLRLWRCVLRFMSFAFVTSVMEIAKQFETFVSLRSLKFNPLWLCGI